MPQDAPDTRDKDCNMILKRAAHKQSEQGDGTCERRSIRTFCYLNDIAGKNGIGLLDMVENRYVGSKSRGVL